ncbi:MAG: exodeoxyribonuclease VII large subunit [Defluviitaleaceae bacterium]|nr:exodeoxyribonuclease VII large subunit [Defluviitaleaceae bacterium]
MNKKRILSVSELTNYIKGVFDDELILHSVVVVGEIEEFKQVGTNTFFTIKDEHSRLSCSLFSCYEDIPLGTKVEITGAVNFWAKNSKISFVAREIKKVGEGEEALALLKLKATLQLEGVFSNKKQLPKFINRVLLITSDAGAVRHDFTEILFNSKAKVDVKFYPVRVQGDEAVADIIKALDVVNNNDIADVVVVMRGGGSAGDLSVFNSEGIARAVSSCRVFTISAVGHETDTTLCDYASDLRMPTPSASASFVAEKLLSVYNKVVTLGLLLAENLDKLYNANYARAMLASFSVERFAGDRITLATANTKMLSARLNFAVDNLLQEKEMLLASLSVKLDSASPLKMLSKGYARIEKDKKAVVSAKYLKLGDNINIFYSDGKVGAKVMEKD